MLDGPRALGVRGGPSPTLSGSDLDCGDTRPAQVGNPALKSGQIAGAVFDGLPIGADLDHVPAAQDRVSRGQEFFKGRDLGGLRRAWHHQAPGFAYQPR